nr:hypothetical protein [Acinetobacter baumannii]KAB1093048.1 hypothetical protein F6W77_19360 [Acinetobacter baumannii]
MKFFIFVLLFGLAVAVPYHGLYRDEDDEGGNEEKYEIKKKLNEELENILKKIKEAIDQGKDIKDVLLEKAKDIREKMKILHIKVSEKTREILSKLKAKLIDWLRQIFGDNDKDRRDVRSKLIDLLRRLRDRLEEVQDEGKIRSYIENNIKSSKLREMLLKVLDQGVEKLKKFLEKFDPPEKRSLEDYFDKFLDILGHVHLTTKEKFDSFIEFLKETYDGGKAVLEDKTTFVRDLARHFLEHAEKTSKKVAEQALEFFRPYREDLGKLYDDLEAKVKEIVNQ